MANIFAKVAYDGTNYLGWQRQPDVDTIQERIETLLSKILNENINIFAAGRTDAGVHALAQTFSFNTTKGDTDLAKLKYSLNRLLPLDIKIISMEYVSDDFHARFSAKGKTYRYLINIGEKDPLNSTKVYQYLRKLDVNKMIEASKLFIGKHRFYNFTTKEIDDKDYYRTIDNIEIEENNNIISITLSGDGFMRYMVRMIVGTLIKVGSGQFDTTNITKLLENKEAMGGTLKVPSCGLYLVEVRY